MWMQFKKVYEFRAQWHWLIDHPEALVVLNWDKEPHRNALSRRYKALHTVKYLFCYPPFNPILNFEGEVVSSIMAHRAVRLHGRRKCG